MPDPKKAPITQTIFAEYATGRHTLNSVRARLAEFGITSRSGKQWSKWAVWQFLTNRLYIGIMDWKGEAFEGKYKPLVTVEQFQKVQTVLKIKSKPRKMREGHNFPFCGVFHCSCGSMMTAQWAKGHGGLYRYYRCTRKNGDCSEPYLQEKYLTAQCLDLIRPAALGAEEAQLIHGIIDQEAAKDSLTLDNTAKGITEKLLPLQEKLDRLTRGYLDQLIDEDSYRLAKEDLVTLKTALKREYERLRKTRSSYWIEPARAVVNTLLSATKPETADSIHELAALVQKIGTNPMISRKQVTFSFAQPYDFVPCLRASQAPSTSNSSSSPNNEKSESLSWCA